MENFLPGPDDVRVQVVAGLPQLGALEYAWAEAGNTLYPSR